MTRRRARRRPSTPLAILAGACLGLGLAGALHLFVMLAVGGLALGLAAATIQARRFAAELAAQRARAARSRRRAVTVTPRRAPAAKAAPVASARPPGPAGPPPCPSCGSLPVATVVDGARLPPWPACGCRPRPAAHSEALRAALRARGQRAAERIPAPPNAPERTP